MRKIAFYSTFILITGIFTLYGCKKDLENISNPQKFSFRESSRFEAILDSIGVIHNQALSFSLDKIKAQNLFADLDSSQAIELVPSLANEYLNNYFSPIPFTYDSTFTDSIWYSILFSSQDPTHNYSLTYQEKITEFLSAYDTSTSPDSFKDYALFFLETTIDSIPVEEQTIFKAAILITFNSFEYWNDNLQSWLNEYTDQNNLTPVALRLFDVKKCGKADLIGAIKGGIKAAENGGGIKDIVTGAVWGAVSASLFSSYQALRQ